MREHNRRPKPGEFYKHFKDKLYQVMAVAIHSETGEEMVVYQALYGTFKVYVRPLCGFVSEVDNVKYPDVTQKYRFERIEFIPAKAGEKINTPSGSDAIKVASPAEKVVASKERILEVRKESSKIDEPAVTTDENLLQFLDAYTCKDKLSILLGIKNHLTDTMLNNMMISMDLPISEGNMEEHYEILKDYLQTRVRFESNRLR